MSKNHKLQLALERLRSELAEEVGYSSPLDWEDEYSSGIISGLNIAITICEHLLDGQEGGDVR